MVVVSSITVLSMLHMVVLAVGNPLLDPALLAPLFVPLFPPLLLLALGPAGALVPRNVVTVVSRLVVVPLIIVRLEEVSVVPVVRSVPVSVV